MEDSFDAIHLKCRVSDFVTDADQESKSEHDENNGKKLPSKPLTMAGKESNRQDNRIQDEILQAEREEETQMDKKESNSNLSHHSSVKSAPITSNRESNVEIR